MRGGSGNVEFLFTVELLQASNEDASEYCAENSHGKKEFLFSGKSLPAFALGMKSSSGNQVMDMWMKE